MIVVLKLRYYISSITFKIFWFLSESKPKCNFGHWSKMTLKLSSYLFLLPKFSRVPFTIVLISLISTIQWEINWNYSNGKIYMEQNHSQVQRVIVFFSVWHWENVFENSWSHFYFTVGIFTISNMFMPDFGPLQVVKKTNSMNRRCLKTSGNHYPWKPPSFNQISSYILSCGCQRHFDEKTDWLKVLWLLFLFSTCDKCYKSF